MQFCEELTEIAAGWIPDLWRLGQAYFTGELRGLTEPKPGNFKKIILTAIEQFCTYIRAAVLSASGQKSLFPSSSLSWPNNSNSAVNQFLQWLPHCLRYVRISYATLIRLDLPNEVLDIVQRLIDQIRLFNLVTVFKKTLDKVKYLEDQETWMMGVSDYPGATLLPSLLEQLIVETLEECHSSCLNPEMREQTILEANSDGQREISQRLQDILDAFCGVIESLAFQRGDDDSQGMGVSQMIGFPNSSHANDGDYKNWSGIASWEQRLLCCMANCMYCHKTFFPHLGAVFTKFGYPVPKLAIESGQATINGLFNSILETYVEHKSDPLLGTIEPSMYIGRFQWSSVQETGKLRPYAHECYDNLVGVYSEIFTISPSLLRLVLEPIVQTVAEELARLMSCVQKFNANGAIQANVDIRLLRDALKLYSNSTAKSFFGEALEAIPQLSPEGEKQVNDMLKAIKSDMKLQLLCFSVQNP